MPKKKVTTPRIRTEKRKPGFFEIHIGDKKISPLTKSELLDKFFININKNLKKDSDLELLIRQYEYVWKKKGKIIYVDSWGHKWEQGASKQVMLDYLKKKQNEITD